LSDLSRSEIRRTVLPYVATDLAYSSLSWNNVANEPLSVMENSLDVANACLLGELATGTRVTGHLLFRVLAKMYPRRYSIEMHRNMRTRQPIWSLARIPSLHLGTANKRGRNGSLIPLRCRHSDPMDACLRAK
jgi:hypothetical protein